MTAVRPPGTSFTLSATVRERRRRGVGGDDAAVLPVDGRDDRDVRHGGGHGLGRGDFRPRRGAAASRSDLTAPSTGPKPTTTVLAWTRWLASRTRRTTARRSVRVTVSGAASAAPASAEQPGPDGAVTFGGATSSLDTGGLVHAVGDGDATTGDGASAATTLRYYRSTDAADNDAPAREVGTDAVEWALAAGVEHACGVDRPDGAVVGGHVLLRGLRGCGGGRIQRHDEQLLVVRCR